MTVLFPLVPNSGMYCETGSSGLRRPCSHSCAMATAPMGFVAESQGMRVLVCMGIPGRDSPRAKSAMGSPRREM